MSSLITGGLHFSSDTNCGICFESLNNGMVIQCHDDSDGKKHPWHEECAIKWITTQKRCPFCRIEIIIPEKLSSKILNIYTGTSILCFSISGIILSSLLTINPPSLDNLYPSVLICYGTLASSAFGTVIGFFTNINKNETAICNIGLIIPFIAILGSKLDVIECIGIDFPYLTCMQFTLLLKGFMITSAMTALTAPAYFAAKKTCELGKRLLNRLF